MSCVKIANTIDTSTPTQKLKQKSQLNISDISFGECSINWSLNPVLLINKIKNAETQAIIIAANTI